MGSHLKGMAERDENYLCVITPDDSSPIEGLKARGEIGVNSLWLSWREIYEMLDDFKSPKNAQEFLQSQLKEFLYMQNDLIGFCGFKKCEEGYDLDETKALQAQIEKLEKIIGRQTIAIDNPRGNAETERVIRTIKEELLWLNEFGSFEEAEARIGAWIEEDYNRLYVHSALRYLSPEEFAQQWVQTQEATSQGAQI